MRLRDADIAAVRRSMIVQAATSNHPASGAIHLGFTATKKIGNAVFRNRAKRRMRAAAHDIVTQHGKPQFDYVLIARKNGVQMPYDWLCRDLQSALEELHRKLS